MQTQTEFTGRTAAEIAASIELAIERGNLAANAVLPTVRELAAANSVSPATVAAAYRLLQIRGLVSGQRRRGTRVVGMASIALDPPVTFPAGVRNLADGNPDPMLLPDLRAALDGVDASPKLYTEDLHYDPLLEIVRAQFLEDGVPAERIAVVSGALDGIDRVLRETLRAGDRVAVEDPCFTGILDLVQASALIPCPMAMDDDGVLPEALRSAISSGASAVIFTPRAQNPTGAALSAGRAVELKRELAGHPELLVIEDDHAGRVAGAPYRTLVSNRSTRWAVVRSVSKFFGPDLRLAVLASDSFTAARVERRQVVGIRWVSHLLQQTVHRLWLSSDALQLLERAERTYGERRESALAALADEGIGASGKSGLNLWIPVPGEEVTAQALLRAGWGVRRGERFRLRTAPAIRVTTATLEPDEARRFAADLRGILEEDKGSSGARSLP